MKKTKEEAALTRKAVLEAAITVFSRKGYAQTSLLEVAKEAGMTRGAIYWHFSNKHQLLATIIDELDKEIKERILKIVEVEKSALEKTRKLIAEFMRITIDEERFRIAEEIIVFKTSPDAELQKLYQKHMDHVREFRHMIIDLIEEGLEAGEFNSRFDAEIVVVALTSYISGLKTAWLSDIVSMSPESLSLTDRIEELADLFIFGINKD
ncbi:MAG: TetR family transcriptional regulator [bacterium]|nr:TetR family transcriptional regulator [bacterium]